MPNKKLRTSYHQIIYSTFFVDQWCFYVPHSWPMPSPTILRIGNYPWPHISSVLMWVKQCHFYYPWLGMVTIPPIKVVMTGGWCVYMRLWHCFTHITWHYACSDEAIYLSTLKRYWSFATLTTDKNCYACNTYLAFYANQSFAALAHILHATQKIAHATLTDLLLRLWIITLHIHLILLL